MPLVNEGTLSIPAGELAVHVNISHRFEAIKIIHGRHPCDGAMVMPLKVTEDARSESLIREMT